MIGSEGVDPSVFHELYQGQAPWDIGRPQPEVETLVADGRFQGRILDVGCGTGHNAMLLAEAGYDVTAIDFVERAVAQARAAADARDLHLHWRVGDALQLPSLVKGQFDTVLDSGVFHVFGDEDRATYVKHLAAVTVPGGLVHVIVFSDKEGGDDGPRRVRRAELEAAFKDGWRLDSMVQTRYGIRSRPEGAKAWRATWRREVRP